MEGLDGWMEGWMDGGTDGYMKLGVWREKRVSLDVDDGIWPGQDQK